MNLIRRGEAVRRLTDIMDSMVEDLEAGFMAGLPIEEKKRPFLRGVAAGVNMAADALATVEPVNLFAGPGILN